MAIVFKNTTKVDEVAEFVFNSLKKQLAQGKKVLLFLAGGSAIPVAVQISKLLEKSEHKNLIITLTDERYVPVGHFNSNYFQLIEKGFKVKELKFIPVLTGDDLTTTTKKFSQFLEEEFLKADYKISLFGIGTDGHTAGIMPESSAVTSLDLVASFDTPVFSRITLTPRAIEELDEAVVWAQGKDKWEVLKELKNDININIQPAQVLKKVPLLTIFTDL